MRRSLNTKWVLAAAAGALASAAAAGPAQAAIGLSSFSVTPSTAQAGGSAGKPGPTLTLDAQFSSTNADTPKDLTIALARGLLANPSIVPLCSTASFNAGACPAASQIGSGTITGTAPQFGFTLSLPTAAYLIQPQGSEVARIGLIVTFFNYPVASQSGPVAIRTTPDVGINILLTGLPNNLDGVPVQINGLHLTIAGSVGGQPFTRNPTACSTATTSLTVDSYGAPSTHVTKTSSFTPTGCSALPYAPKISGTITADKTDDGIALSTTVTQGYSEADDETINLAFPFSASPRLSAFGAACTNPNLSNCPSIGTASITTPLLPQTLTAQVVLVSHPGQLPTLAILVPAPFGIQLTATPVLTGSSVQALVTNVPDIPISKLTLNLPGGPNSLFRAGLHLCTQAQSFAGTFTAWSGATASPSAAATVSGCPAGAPVGGSVAGSSPAASVRPRHYVLAGSPDTARAAVGAGLARFAGLASATPRLTFAVGGGRGSEAMRSISVRLPSGLALRSTRSIAVTLDGHAVRAAVRVHGRTLTVRFARPGRVAIVTVGSRALRVSRSLRAKHSSPLTLLVTIRRAGGRTTNVRIVARGR